LQSLLIEHPWASFVGGVLSPPHDARATKRTARIATQVEVDREAFKVPSKLAHVTRSLVSFQASAYGGNVEPRERRPVSDRDFRLRELSSTSLDFLRMLGFVAETEEA
jgi:hypothetical protein